MSTTNTLNNYDTIVECVEILLSENFDDFNGEKHRDAMREAVRKEYEYQTNFYDDVCYEFNSNAFEDVMNWFLHHRDKINYLMDHTDRGELQVMATIQRNHCSMRPERNLQRTEYEIKQMLPGELQDALREATHAIV